MTTFSPDPDDVRAHLSMMQSVITRMAENSRACKTWSVTIVAAILVAVARFGMSISSESETGFGIVWITTVPVLVFYGLDVYYLALERSFIQNYRNFVEQLHAGRLERQAMFMIPARTVDFSNTTRAMFSVTIWPVYLMMMGAISAVHLWG